ncbi:LysM peptidoglycan-binding domain-containing protein [Nocardioides ultimimeridianus]
MSHHASAPPLRAAAVWLVTAAATAGTGLLSAPAVLAVGRSAGSAPFDQLLVAGSGTLASLGCLALLATTTAVVVDLATGRLPRRVGPLRRAVLVACGAAVLAGAAPAAAHAGTAGHGHGSALAGLPLPDRVTGAVRHADDIVRVRSGDSLWAISARHLGARAGDGEVAAYCQRLSAHNAAAIGSDPDLIHPGLRLQLPPSRPLDR